MKMGVHRNRDMKRASNTRYSIGCELYLPEKLRHTLLTIPASTIKPCTQKLHNGTATVKEMITETI